VFDQGSAPSDVQRNQGETKYLLKQHRNSLHGSFRRVERHQRCNAGGEVLAKTRRRRGSSRPTDHPSGPRPTEWRTRVVSNKADGSNYSLLTLGEQCDPAGQRGAVAGCLRQLQDRWDCVSCYGNKEIREPQHHGRRVPGHPKSAFEEAKVNPTLTAFLKYVVSARLTRSVYGFTSVLCVERPVKAGARTA